MKSLLKKFQTPCPTCAECRVDDYKGRREELKQRVIELYKKAND